MTIAPVLSPHGLLSIAPSPDVALEAGRAARLEKAFARGTGHGLLHLGADAVGAPLPAVWAYWRELGERYVTALCALPGIADSTAKPTAPLPPDGTLEQMAFAVPPMTGAEYLTVDGLAGLWQAIDAAFGAELAESGLPVQSFLKSRHRAWNLVGRVYFNLAENRRDEAAPFAFMATYTTRLSKDAKAQHLPLGKALQEYAGARNRERLLSLLMPVNQASDACPWLKALVDSGDIFHPLRWTPDEALRFLKDVPAMESAGVLVRMPASWRMNRPARPQVQASVGGKPPTQLGLDALLDFKMEVTLDGEPLTAAEIKRLLAQTSGLVFMRGRWIELDAERLRQTLDRFEAVDRHARQEGLSFLEAVRLMAGADGNQVGAADAADRAWGQAVAGPWLAETLAALRGGGDARDVDPGPLLHGTLRPYQRSGLQWLHLLARLRLGACLADDMGLGKTIQILSLLLVLKRESPAVRKPSLLVVPASLLANWAAEIARFAPSLETAIIHPSSGDTEELAANLARFDLVITSFGFLAREKRLAAADWRLAIVDEAQAIKNPGARQTRSVKQLKAEARIALTGTPIENRLGDLWSIFDFINPGLLGSAKQFSDFVKHLADRPHLPYAPLRDLVRPYILRRLKTDKSIIADLPDKTEVKAFCGLSRKQAALYREAVDDLKDEIESSDGIRRRGIVLAAMVRLKQICNHPSHWLGDGGWAEEDSGKLQRLREIAEVAASRQEKALVFTQFQEATAPLSSFLASVFGRPGLVLHGGTAVARRKDLVRRFQEDEHVPFFVLSLKAGGAGLNLTAASHVIHFDRWWNPAVENQATDRAFRIGQTKNVLVHKFVCRGTVEEKIDLTIETKSKLAGEFLSGDAELPLTELDDDELLKLVALDLGTAMKQD